MTPVVKKKRHYTLLLAPLLVTLIVMSPYLLSSSPALHFFLSTVNRNISGKLSIESWLIGWQQGILCQNVVYSDQERGISISIPRLTSNRGLMEFILAPKNFGTVHIERPMIELSGSAIRTFFARGKAEQVATGGNSHFSSVDPPLWDKVFVTLQSRGGELRTVWEERDRSVSFANISVDSTLAAGEATFAIGFYTMGQGLVEMSGALNLPAHDYGWLETILAETQITMRSLPLQDFLQAGSIFSRMPQGEGVVNGDFHLKVAGLDSIEIDGLAELADARLHGSFWGDDQPFFRNVTLSLEEGRWSENGMSLKGLSVLSDTLNLKGSGRLLPGAIQLTAHGALSLPVLFDQVPHLLGVNEETFVDTGTVDFSVELDTISAVENIKLKAKAKDIGGIFHEQRFFWNSPATLIVSGEKKGEDLQVEAFQLDAPFARAKGSGGLQSFALDGTVDLEKALSDIGMLFQLDLSGSGILEIEARSAPAEDEPERFKATANLRIDDFQLKRGEEVIAPHHQFSATGTCLAPNTFFSSNEGEVDSQLVLSSWLGELFLVLNGDKAANLPFKGYYTTDSELYLGNMSGLFHALHLINSKTGMDGIMQVQADGFVGEGSLEVRGMEAEISDLLLEGNGTVFRDPSIKLQIIQPMNEGVPFLSIRGLQVAEDQQSYLQNGGGKNLIVLPERKVSLRNVQLEAESGTLSLESLVIPDWRNPLTGGRGKFSLSADLGKICKGLQAGGLLAPETSLSGSAQGSFLLAKGDSMQEMNAELAAADVSMERKGGGVFVSKKVVFSTLISGLIPDGEISVKRFKLDSDILAFDAAGKVSHGESGRLLELNGKLTPDLALFSSMIAQELNVDLTMKGRPEEPLHLEYRLGSLDGEPLTRLMVSGSLHADTVTVDGSEMTEVALSFHFADSTLHSELSGRISGGTLRLVTDTDFAADPAVIKATGSSRFMQGVRVEEPLVDILFSKIDPLFGTLAEVTGLADIRLDSLWWPINGKAEKKAGFIIIIDTRAMQLESSSLFQDILAIFGLEGQQLQLRDNEIYCRGGHGKVQCSPVLLVAGETEIRVQTIVFRDGRLDCRLEIPLTAKLTDDKRYKALAGMTVEVAVSGTRKKPFFDREKVLSSVEELLKQAEEGIEQKKEKTGEPLSADK